MKYFVLGMMLIMISACDSIPTKRTQTKEKTPATVYIQLGVQYFREGEYKTALIKLEKALEIEPNSADAHGAIAISYEHMGRIDLAGQHYKRAVELNPNDPGLHNNYGVFLCKSGDIAAAESHFLIAVKDPFYATPEAAYTNAGVCLYKKPDLKSAEAYFRQALRVNPHFPDALSQMVKLSYEKHKYLSARAFLQRYEAERELQAPLLWLAILIEKALGDEASMQNHILNLKTKYPDSLEAKQLIVWEQRQKTAQVERVKIQPVVQATNPPQVESWGTGVRKPMQIQSLAPVKVLAPKIAPAMQPIVLPEKARPVIEAPIVETPVIEAPVIETPVTVMDKIKLPEIQPPIVNSSGTTLETDESHAVESGRE